MTSRSTSAFGSVTAIGTSRLGADGRFRIIATVDRPFGAIHSAVHELPINPAHTRAVLDLTAIGDR